MNGAEHELICPFHTNSVPYGEKITNGITFHDIRRTVKTNMLNAGVDKTYRDMILGHSLQGMDVHYLVPSEEDLMDAMEKYTLWFDDEIESAYKMLTNPLTKTS